MGFWLIYMGIEGAGGTLVGVVVEAERLNLSGPDNSRYKIEGPDDGRINLAGAETTNYELNG